ncbi:MAG: hypothetical protein V4490_01905, partial [Pseudomonadota bacterium]
MKRPITAKDLMQLKSKFNTQFAKHQIPFGSAYTTRQKDEHLADLVMPELSNLVKNLMDRPAGKPCVSRERILFTTPHAGVTEALSALLVNGQLTEASLPKLYELYNQYRTFPVHANTEDALYAELSILIAFNSFINEHIACLEVDDTLPGFSKEKSNELRCFYITTLEEHIILIAQAIFLIGNESLTNLNFNTASVKFDGMSSQDKLALQMFLEANLPKTIVRPGEHSDEALRDNVHNLIENITFLLRSIQLYPILDICFSNLIIQNTLLYRFRHTATGVQDQSHLFAIHSLINFLQNSALDIQPNIGDILTEYPMPEKPEGQAHSLFAMMALLQEMSVPDIYIGLAKTGLLRQLERNNHLDIIDACARLLGSFSNTLQNSRDSLFLDAIETYYKTINLEPHRKQQVTRLTSDRFFFPFPSILRGIQTLPLSESPAALAEIVQRDSTSLCANATPDTMRIACLALYHSASSVSADVTSAKSSHPKKILLFGIAKMLSQLVMQVRKIKGNVTPVELHEVRCKIIFSMFLYENYTKEQVLFFDKYFGHTLEGLEHLGDLPAAQKDLLTHTTSLRVQLLSQYHRKAFLSGHNLYFREAPSTLEADNLFFEQLCFIVGNLLLLRRAELAETLIPCFHMIPNKTLRLRALMSLHNVLERHSPHLLEEKEPHSRIYTALLKMTDKGTSEEEFRTFCKDIVLKLNAELPPTHRIVDPFETYVITELETLSHHFVSIDTQEKTQAALTHLKSSSFS